MPYFTFCITKIDCDFYIDVAETTANNRKQPANNRKQPANNPQTTRKQPANNPQTTRKQPANNPQWTVISTLMVALLITNSQMSNSVAFLEKIITSSSNTKTRSIWRLKESARS